MFFGRSRNKIHKPFTLKDSFHDYIKDKDLTKQELKIKENHLNRKAKIIKENPNLKRGYVLLLYALRIADKRLKEKQEKLIKSLSHNQELLNKIELK